MFKEVFELIISYEKSVLKTVEQEVEMVSEENYSNRLNEFICRYFKETSPFENQAETQKLDLCINKAYDFMKIGKLRQNMIRAICLIVVCSSMNITQTKIEERHTL
jgi:hypothetical protein